MKIFDGGKVVTTALILLALSTAGSWAANTRPNSGQMPVPRAAAGKGTLLLSYAPLYNTIVLEKNVSSVSSPATGVFCVVPAKAISSNALPTVTVEWGLSAGNALFAFYDIGGESCAAGQIEVRTFDANAGGAPVPSYNVAFDVFVP